MFSGTFRLIFNENPVRYHLPSYRRRRAAGGGPGPSARRRRGGGPAVRRNEDTALGGTGKRRSHGPFAREMAEGHAQPFAAPSPCAFPPEASLRHRPYAQYVLSIPRRTRPWTRRPGHDRAQHLEPPAELALVPPRRPLDVRPIQSDHLRRGRNAANLERLAVQAGTRRQDGRHPQRHRPASDRRRGPGGGFGDRPRGCLPQDSDGLRLPAGEGSADTDPGFQTTAGELSLVSRRWRGNTR